MRILALSGSLQAGSTNTALARAAATVAPPAVTVRVGATLGALPHFNPDLVASPPAVDAFRRDVTAADAVLIFSPEYAHGVPGVLKNALDWLVGSGELYEKPVAVVCGSPRPDGGSYLRRHLSDTLGAQGAELVAVITIAVPAADRADPAANPEVRAQLEALLGQLAAAG